MVEYLNEMILFYITSAVLLISVFWRILCFKYNLPWPAFLAFWLENPYMKIFANPNALVKHLEIAEDAHALEIGSGAGRILHRLALSKNGNGTHIGIELQKKMIFLARKNLSRLPKNIARSIIHANIDVTKIQPGHSELSKNKFDLILLVTVLGEIPDKVKVLKIAKRLLKERGVIVIQEVIPDPCYVSSVTIHKYAKAAGLRHVKTQKNRLNYISTFGL